MTITRSHSLTKLALAACIAVLFVAACTAVCAPTATAAEVSSEAALAHMQHIPPPPASDGAAHMVDAEPPPAPDDPMVWLFPGHFLREYALFGFGRLLSSPNALAWDHTSTHHPSVIVVDRQRHQVLRFNAPAFDTPGSVTVVVGTGQRGYTPLAADERRPGNQVAINAPSGVTVDSHGNVFVSDTENHRILRIDSEGFATRFAGTEEEGFNTEGVATERSLSYPYGIAITPEDDLVVVDSGNHLLRKVSRDGTDVLTLAGREPGSNAPDIGFPTVVAVGKNGRTVFASGETIYELKANGTLEILAGEGSANYPLMPTIQEIRDHYAASDDEIPDDPARMVRFTRGIAITDHNHVIVTDSGMNLIREIVSPGVFKTIVGKNYVQNYYRCMIPAVAAGTHRPTGVAAIDGGGLVFVEEETGQVRFVGLKNDHRLAAIARRGIANVANDRRDLVESAYDAIGAFGQDKELLAFRQRETGGPKTPTLRHAVFSEMRRMAAFEAIHAAQFRRASMLQAAQQNAPQEEKNLIGEPARALQSGVRHIPTEDEFGFASETLTAFAHLTLEDHGVNTAGVPGVRFSASAAASAPASASNSAAAQDSSPRNGDLD